MNQYKGHGDQRYGHITYSHCGEDIMLLNLLELIRVKNPTYLDVGAHHPFNMSNTALMYSKGYRGVNIEANPNLIGEFITHRKEDQNMNIGIGPKSGTMPFYMFDSHSGRNTFVKEKAQPFFHDNHWFNITEIKQIEVLTLDDLISQHVLFWPDVLCLDLEGLDTEVICSSDLRGIDFYGPKIICIEALYSDDNTSLKDALTNRGYFCYCRLSVDLIFVREEYRELVY